MKKDKKRISWDDNVKIVEYQDPYYETPAVSADYKNIRGGPSKFRNDIPVQGLMKKPGQDFPVGIPLSLSQAFIDKHGIPPEDYKPDMPGYRHEGEMAFVGVDSDLESECSVGSGSATPTPGQGEGKENGDREVSGRAFPSETGAEVVEEAAVADEQRVGVDSDLESDAGVTEGSDNGSPVMGNRQLQSFNVVETESDNPEFSFAKFAFDSDLPLKVAVQLVKEYGTSEATKSKKIDDFENDMRNGIKKEIELAQAYDAPAVAILRDHTQREFSINDVEILELLNGQQRDVDQAVQSALQEKEVQFSENLKPPFRGLYTVSCPKGLVAMSQVWAHFDAKKFALYQEAVENASEENKGCIPKPTPTEKLAVVFKPNLENYRRQQKALRMLCDGQPKVGQPDVVSFHPMREAVLGKKTVLADRSWADLPYGSVAVVVGPPGTGKTLLIRAEIDICCSRGMKVLYVSNANSQVAEMSTKIHKEAQHSVVKYASKSASKDRSVKSPEEVNTIMAQVPEYKKLVSMKEVKAKSKVGLGKEFNDELGRLQAQWDKDCQEHVQITCATVANAIQVQGWYDLVIVDEACLTSISEFLTCVIKGGKAILVGDPAQGHPVVKRVADKVATMSVITYFESGPSYVYRFLGTQYRMPHELCALHSDLFYNSRVVTSPDADFLRVEWVNNVSEAWISVDKDMNEWADIGRETAQFVAHLIEHGVPPKEIIVVCPYTKGVVLIGQAVAPEVKVSTSTACQGQQQSVLVVVPTVEKDNRPTPFYNCVERVNVSVSRCRSSRFFIGSARTYQSRSVYGVVHRLMKTQKKEVKDWTVIKPAGPWTDPNYWPTQEIRKHNATAVIPHKPLAIPAIRDKMKRVVTMDMEDGTKKEVVVKPLVRLPVQAGPKIEEVKADEKEVVKTPSGGSNARKDAGSKVAFQAVDAVKEEKKPVELQFEEGDATVIHHNGPAIIAHICNDVGVCSGFVVPLGVKYPAAQFGYQAWHKGLVTDPQFGIGKTQFVNVGPSGSESSIVVANMVAQRGTGRGGDSRVDLAALEACLQEVKDVSNNRKLKIQMPKVGTGIGQTGWKEIENVIRNSLVGLHDSAVIYYLGKVIALPAQVDEGAASGEDGTPKSDTKRSSKKKNNKSPKDKPDGSSANLPTQSSGNTEPSPAQGNGIGPHGPLNENDFSRFKKVLAEVWVPEQPELRKPENWMKTSKYDSVPQLDIEIDKDRKVLKYFISDELVPVEEEDLYLKAIGPKRLELLGKMKNSYAQYVAVCKQGFHLVLAHEERIVCRTDEDRLAVWPHIERITKTGRNFWEFKTEPVEKEGQISQAFRAQAFPCLVTATELDSRLVSDNDYADQVKIGIQTEIPFLPADELELLVPRDELMQKELSTESKNAIAKLEGTDEFPNVFGDVSWFQVCTDPKSPDCDPYYTCNHNQKKWPSVQKVALLSNGTTIWIGNHSATSQKQFDIVVGCSPKIKDADIKVRFDKRIDQAGEIQSMIAKIVRSLPSAEYVTGTKILFACNAGVDYSVEAACCFLLFCTLGRVTDEGIFENVANARPCVKHRIDTGKPRFAVYSNKLYNNLKKDGLKCLHRHSGSAAAVLAPANIIAENVVNAKVKTVTITLTEYLRPDLMASFLKLLAIPQLVVSKVSLHSKVIRLTRVTEPSKSLPEVGLHTIPGCMQISWKKEHMDIQLHVSAEGLPMVPAMAVQPEKEPIAFAAVSGDRTSVTKVDNQNTNFLGYWNIGIYGFFAASRDPILKDQVNTFLNESRVSILAESKIRDAALAKAHHTLSQYDAIRCGKRFFFNNAKVPKQSAGQAGMIIAVDEALMGRTTVRNVVSGRLSVVRIQGDPNDDGVLKHNVAVIPIYSPFIGCQKERKVAKDQCEKYARIEIDRAIADGYHPIFIGDTNAIAKDSDCWQCDEPGDEWRTAFTTSDEERNSMLSMVSGLKDAMEDRRFTWFKDYTDKRRNRGLKIDHAFASPKLVDDFKFRVIRQEKSFFGFDHFGIVGNFADAPRTRPVQVVSQLAALLSTDGPKAFLTDQLDDADPRKGLPVPDGSGFPARPPLLKRLPVEPVTDEEKQAAHIFTKLEREFPDSHCAVILDKFNSGYVRQEFSDCVDACDAHVDDYSMATGGLLDSYMLDNQIFHALEKCQVKDSNRKRQKGKETTTCGFTLQAGERGTKMVISEQKATHLLRLTQPPASASDMLSFLASVSYYAQALGPYWGPIRATLAELLRCPAKDYQKKFFSDERYTEAWLKARNYLGCFTYEAYTFQDSHILVAVVDSSPRAAGYWVIAVDRDALAQWSQETPPTPENFQVLCCYSKAWTAAKRQRTALEAETQGTLLFLCKEFEEWKNYPMILFNDNKNLQEEELLSLHPATRAALVRQIHLVRDRIALAPFLTTSHLGSCATSQADVLTQLNGSGQAVGLQYIDSERELVREFLFSKQRSSEAPTKFHSEKPSTHLAAAQDHPFAGMDDPDMVLEHQIAAQAAPEFLPKGGIDDFVCYLAEIPQAEVLLSMDQWEEAVKLEAEVRQPQPEGDGCTAKVFSAVECEEIKGADGDLGFGGCRVPGKISVFWEPCSTKCLVAHVGEERRTSFNDCVLLGCEGMRDESLEHVHGPGERMNIAAFPSVENEEVLGDASDAERQLQIAESKDEEMKSLLRDVIASMGDEKKLRAGDKIRLSDEQVAVLHRNWGCKSAAENYELLRNSSYHATTEQWERAGKKCLRACGSRHKDPVASKGKPKNEDIWEVDTFYMDERLGYDRNDRLLNTDVDGMGGHLAIRVLRTSSGRISAKIESPDETIDKGVLEQVLEEQALAVREPSIIKVTDNAHKEKLSILEPKSIVLIPPKTTGIGKQKGSQNFQSLVGSAQYILRLRMMNSARVFADRNLSVESLLKYHTTQYNLIRDRVCDPSWVPLRSGGNEALKYLQRQLLVDSLWHLMLNNSRVKLGLKQRQCARVSPFIYELKPEDEVLFERGMYETDFGILVARYFDTFIVSSGGQEYHVGPSRILRMRDEGCGDAWGLDMFNNGVTVPPHLPSLQDKRWNIVPLGGEVIIKSPSDARDAGKMEMIRKKARESFRRGYQFEAVVKGMGEECVAFIRKWKQKEIPTPNKIVRHNTLKCFILAGWKSRKSDIQSTTVIQQVGIDLGVVGTKRMIYWIFKHQDNRMGSSVWVEGDRVESHAFSAVAEVGNGIPEQGLPSGCKVPEQGPRIGMVDPFGEGFEKREGVDELCEEAHIIERMSGFRSEQPENPVQAFVGENPSVNVERENGDVGGVCADPESRRARKSAEIVAELAEKLRFQNQCMVVEVVVTEGEILLVGERGGRVVFNAEQKAFIGEFLDEDLEVVTVWSGPPMLVAKALSTVAEFLLMKSSLAARTYGPKVFAVEGQVVEDQIIHLDTEEIEVSEGGNVRSHAVISEGSTSISKPTKVRVSVPLKPGTAVIAFLDKTERARVALSGTESGGREMMIFSVPPTQNIEFWVRPIGGAKKVRRALPILLRVLSTEEDEELKCLGALDEEEDKPEQAEKKEKSAKTGKEKGPKDGSVDAESEDTALDTDAESERKEPKIKKKKNTKTKKKDKEGLKNPATDAFVAGFREEELMSKSRAYDPEEVLAEVLREAESVCFEAAVAQKEKEGDPEQGLPKKTDEEKELEEFNKLCSGFRRPEGDWSHWSEVHKGTMAMYRDISDVPLADDLSWEKLQTMAKDECETSEQKSVVEQMKVEEFQEYISAVQSFRFLECEHIEGHSLRISGVLGVECMSSRPTRQQHPKARKSNASPDDKRRLKLLATVMLLQGLVATFVPNVHPELIYVTEGLRAARAGKVLGRLVFVLCNVNRVSRRLHVVPFGTSNVFKKLLRPNGRTFTSGDIASAFLSLVLSKELSSYFGLMVEGSPDLMIAIHAMLGWRPLASCFINRTGPQLTSVASSAKGSVRFGVEMLKAMAMDMAKGGTNFGQCGTVLPQRKYETIDEISSDEEDEESDSVEPEEEEEPVQAFSVEYKKHKKDADIEEFYEAITNPKNKWEVDWCENMKSVRAVVVEELKGYERWCSLGRTFVHNRMTCVALPHRWTVAQVKEVLSQPAKYKEYTKSLMLDGMCMAGTPTGDEGKRVGTLTSAVVHGLCSPKCAEWCRTVGAELTWEDGKTLSMDTANGPSEQEDSIKVRLQIWGVTTAGQWFNLGVRGFQVAQMFKSYDLGFGAWDLISLAHEQKVGFCYLAGKKFACKL